MNTETIISTEQNSFNLIKFIGANKRNRVFIWIASISIIIQFIIFKILYPFADYFSDSYSYIFAAKANLDVNIWPIGYSIFLRLFHLITHSDTALVGFQYSLLEISALYLFYSTLYLFNISRISRNILFAFLFFNPLFLYVCNYINSDPLFVALSLFWFTQLLWIIHKPAWHQIITHGIILFLSFTIRNNAYYYPFITAICYLISDHKRWLKSAGIAFPTLLIFSFIIHTRNAAFKLTGVKQFSLFTGWQLANNALYLYDKIKVDSSKLPSQESRKLNDYSSQFYSQMPSDFHKNILSDYVGNFFIRQPESPLKFYLYTKYKITDNSSGIIAWGKASKVYGEFGKHIIMNYPIAYARYFMLLNLNNYFLPPLEKLETYNLGLDEVDPIAAEWFHYSSTKVTSVGNNAQKWILLIFPKLFLVLNLYIFIGIVWFLIRKQYNKVSPQFNRILAITIIFQAANLVFCAFATIVVLRYQVFPMIIGFAFVLLLTEAFESKEILENHPSIVSPA